MVQNDIPLRSKLANFRRLDRGEVKTEHCVPLGVSAANLAELTILLVAGETLDETFGRQQFLASLPYPRVNVSSGPAAIRHRLDRPEVVLACGASKKSTVSLEVRVERTLVLRVLLQVSAVLIALPDLDHRIPQRLTTRVKNPAAEVRDFPHSRRDAVVDDQQVVIGVDWKFGGVERSFVGRRCSREFFRERASRGESGCSQRKCAEKLASMRS